MILSEKQIAILRELIRQIVESESGDGTLTIVITRRHIRAISAKVVQNRSEE